MKQNMFAAFLSFISFVGVCFFFLSANASSLAQAHCETRLSLEISKSKNMLDTSDTASSPHGN